jgi:hypothetical protein
MANKQQRPPQRQYEPGQGDKQQQRPQRQYDPDDQKRRSNVPGEKEPYRGGQADEIDPAGQREWEAKEEDEEEDEEDER